MTKTKAHQVYKVDGQRVPGVTTIIGNLGWNTNVLMAWARREALKGNDPDKIRDQAAERGTLAHALIEEHLAGVLGLEGREVDRSEYAPADLEVAENAFLAYLDWEGRNKVEPIGLEYQLSHPELMYGGTIDLLAWLNDKLAVIDFKTTNGVYAEHRIQVAAYTKLVLRHLGTTGDLAWLAQEVIDLGVDLNPEVHLLQLSKTDGTFSHHRYDDLTAEWDVFQHCLSLHALHKLLR